MSTSIFCERRKGSEKFFPQSYWTFKQRIVLQIFFSIWHMEQKMFQFDHIIDIRDVLARSGSAETQFDVSLLGQFPIHNF